MRITHIIVSERYVEGESYQENLLTQKHKELGNEVFIIASQRVHSRQGTYFVDSGHYVNNYGIDVTVLPTKKHTYWYYISDKCYGLYEILCKQTPDVIFCHQFSNWDIRHVIRYKYKHPEVVVYADNHNDYFNNPIKGVKGFIHSCMAKIYGKLMIPITKRFWGTLPWRCLYLENVYHIPKEKIGLLVMGADETKIQNRDRALIRNTIREKYLLPENAFVIVSGGYLDKRKHQDLLAEAIRQLGRENIRLLIFGKPTNEMTHVFDSYKGCENIVMTGHIPSSDIYDLFIASDLAIFPGTHSVLWEQAVACGLPSVFKYWEHITHVNENGNAILLKEVSVNTIKKTIIDLNFTKKYKEMKRKAILCAPHFYLREIAIRAITE